jgi:hypothetical protein
MFSMSGKCFNICQNTNPVVYETGTRTDNFSFRIACGVEERGNEQHV